MKTIQPLIRTHLTKYPLMELTDMIKLLYQNEFGPGHMISDESESLKRLTEEWESLPRLSSSPLTEPIGNHLVRVHLAALNREELSLLNAMFCRTAGQTQGNREQFMKRLDCLSLYFPHADGFLTDYKKEAARLLATAITIGRHISLPIGLSRKAMLPFYSLYALLPRCQAAPLYA